VPDIEGSRGSASREKHILERNCGLGQSSEDADSNHQGDAVADAPVGNLLTQPHEEHCAGRQHNGGLDAIPPEMVGRIQKLTDPLESRYAIGIFPTQRHHKPLAEAEKHSQVPPVLNDLCATAFFTSQFA